MTYRIRLVQRNPSEDDYAKLDFQRRTAVAASEILYVVLRHYHPELTTEQWIRYLSDTLETRENLIRRALEELQSADASRGPFSERRAYVLARVDYARTGDEEAYRDAIAAIGERYHPD